MFYEGLWRASPAECFIKQQEATNLTRLTTICQGCTVEFLVKVDVVLQMARNVLLASGIR